MTIAQLERAIVAVTPSITAGNCKAGLTSPFESMGMGIPVLHGVAGESAEIVKKEGVGLVFEPENVEDLCQKLVMLSSDHGLYEELRGRCIEAAPCYDRSVLAGRMLEVLSDLLEHGKPGHKADETALIREERS